MTIHDPKDLQNTGKHDFDATTKIYKHQQTFSFIIFRWLSRSNPKKGLKPSDCVVRVRGNVSNFDAVLAYAKNAVEKLDNGTWSGNKTVTIKKHGK